MNIYIDLDTGHVVSNAVAANLPHVESRTVTNDEFEALLEAQRVAEMSPADHFREIERAFDKHIDDVAAARGYGRNGHSPVAPSEACKGFAGYPNPWQAEAIKFAQWSTNCCALLIQGQADVIAGTRTMPTPAQAIAELPPMVW